MTAHVWIIVGVTAWIILSLPLGLAVGRIFRGVA